MAKSKPKICLCLTEKTLEADAKIVAKYANRIDVAELRVDALDRDEQFLIRRFPEMVSVPTILTIRRTCDGGFWDRGEGARISLFATALAFPNENPAKNFAFVDFEDDFRVPCLQDAALAFETKIIRSRHDFSSEDFDLQKIASKMQISPLEIPKIAVMPKNLRDSLKICEAAQKIKGEKIIAAMGEFGKPLRLMSQKINSQIVYAHSPENASMAEKTGQIDIDSLLNIYRFQDIDDSTKFFAITGNPLGHSCSPSFHNNFFAENGINSRYIALTANAIDESLEFAQKLGICGMSVTAPFKETVTPFLSQKTDVVNSLGACNTIVKFDDGWHGWNTDVDGILSALRKFTGKSSLRQKKVALIGAGGAAKAFAYALKTLGARVCVFNRHAGRARNLAEKYGFKWSALGDADDQILRRYSDLIVNATSCGMEGCDKIDPIPFYSFSGDELVYDVIYNPEETPFLHRAKEAGCKTENGFSLFLAQAEVQSQFFAL